MKRLRRGLISAWILLLVCSNIWRFLGPQDPLPADLLQIPISAPGAGQQVLAWQESGTANLRTPLLLLNGSPPARYLLAPLAKELAAGERKIYIPDLPGFGFSTTNAEGYGFDSQARLISAWIDSLSLPPLHVIAYSQGGGIALHLAANHPDQLASLTLLSSIGVIEHELLGDYTLNHSLHALQLLGIRLFEWGLPHFGLLDRFPLNEAYALNFLQSDQRPLRKLLEHYDGPALIVHGLSDALVPYGAAREHYRLLPQSELATFDGGHTILYTLANEVAMRIEVFLETVDHGEGIVRQSSSATRRLNAARPVTPPQSYHGIALWLLLVGIALATLISEDLACIAAGLLAARALISFPEAVGASLVGIVVGDLMLFLAGKVMGQRLAERPWFRKRLTPERMAEARSWFDRRGALTVLLARFLPGSRLPTYLVAGISGASTPVFLFWFLLAAALWTPLLVGAAMLAGENLLGVYKSWSWTALPALVLLLSLLHLFFHTLPGLFSKRGRVLFLSRLEKMKLWEFWPAFVFYPPVVVHVLWLGLRHRSMTLFSIVNPGIPLSGFRGESKSDILKPLMISGDAPPFVFLASADVMQWSELAHNAATEFLFPLVLKPDQGERGSNVHIVKDTVELDVLIASVDHNRDWLIQKFAAGQEYGVFYARYPHETKGRVLSICKKEKLTILADGTRSIEELILAHPRARLMANFYLKQQTGQLQDILPSQTPIALTDLGTHSRGAIFHDANHLWSSELENSIDQISKSMPGFYFGRYDLVSANDDLLKKGQDLLVLEVNGVTGEMAHIYEPGSSVFAAWKTLREQWSLAFKIGAEQHSLGHRPASVATILKAAVGS